MTKPIKRIAVTGGAGQIAYSLLFRIASGELFGADQPVALHILEVPAVLPALEGVKMELEDCAFPLLQDIRIGSDPFELFKDIDYALLIGAKPRSQGMERKDLLQENAKIFVEQSKALQESAQPGVKVFVVGNPCNTNCLIALNHAPRIPKQNFHAMMRLDQNRAAFQLARKAQVDISAVTNVTIWGNHSATQVPDFFHARIQGKPLLTVIEDRQWLEGEFISSVQKRGAAIIQARGKSSASSAAQALLDDIRAHLHPTAPSQWYSSAVYSQGNSYGIAEDLVFSFPLLTRRPGQWDWVANLELNEFLEKKLRVSEQELLEERDLVHDMFNL